MAKLTKYQKIKTIRRSKKANDADIAFAQATRKLAKFADAGYGVGITIDGHCGVWADIGSECCGIGEEGSDWIELATDAIEKALAKKGHSNDAPTD